MVTSPNATVRSDYRLYNSDNNVTAKKWVNPEFRAQIN